MHQQVVMDSVLNLNGDCCSQQLIQRPMARVAVRD